MPSLAVSSAAASGECCRWGVPCLASPATSERHVLRVARPLQGGERRHPHGANRLPELQGLAADGAPPCVLEPEAGAREPPDGDDVELHLGRQVAAGGAAETPLDSAGGGIAGRLRNATGSSRDRARYHPSRNKKAHASPAGFRARSTSFRPHLTWLRRSWAAFPHFGPHSTKSGLD